MLKIHKHLKIHEKKRETNDLRFRFKQWSKSDLRTQIYKLPDS